MNFFAGSNESSETSSAEVKMINAEDFIDMEDDVMDEYCDKITLAAGVTAKDKRLKDNIAGNGSRDENSKKLKKLTGKGNSSQVSLMLVTYVFRIKFSSVVFSGCRKTNFLFIYLHKNLNNSRGLIQKYIFL